MNLPATWWSHLSYESIGTSGELGCLGDDLGEDAVFLVDLLAVLAVHAVVGNNGLQGADHATCLAAPAGEVGELPPPERFDDPIPVVMLEAVAEVDGDLRKVVGQAVGLGRGLGRIRIEDLDVMVDGVEQFGERGTQVFDVRVEARIGLEPLLGHDVADRCQSPAGKQQLGYLEEQQRDSAVRLADAGYLTQGDEEALHLVCDLAGEVG